MQLEMRVEKTTRNADDFRVLMVGILVAIMLMLVQPLIIKAYDGFLSPRPFITATLNIAQIKDQPVPMLLYDADAIQVIDATWIASIRDEMDNQLETRRGNFTYGMSNDNPRLWTWSSFFNNGEAGYVPPVVPVVDFKVCLRYISTTRRSGILDETPEICSKLFHPLGSP